MSLITRYCQIGVERRFEICILLLATALRLWALDCKPPHFDEGINGFFADRVREVGFYRYDPTNYHGPLYFYALFIMQTLFGRSLWVLRMPAVLASIATVWLALRWDRFFGKIAARCGALALAISPAAVFYGRYAIHESWLTAALMVFVLGLFGLWKFGDRRSLFIAFAGATLMLLLKETAVIHLACFGLAAGCLLLWKKIVPSQPALSLAKQQWRSCDFFWAFGLLLAALFFFYSGTFLNCHGFFDLFRTLPAWIHTGVAGGGHVKTDYQIGFFNYYWLALIARYEWPSLLGLVFTLPLLWRSSAMARYLAIDAVGVLIAYSIVPYKTPWCIISILWPFALLFGIAVEEAWNYQRWSNSQGIKNEFTTKNTKIAQRTQKEIFYKKILGIKGSQHFLSNVNCDDNSETLVVLHWRIITSIIVALALLGSLVICVRLNFWNFVNFKEPYVYVQTSPEIYCVTDPLLAMAHKDRQNLHLRGTIFLESYFPLPWMLGDFTSIIYYNKSQRPQQLDADFILIEKSRSAEIEKKIHASYYREEFQLRDAMEQCVVYFKVATFHRLFESPDFHGKKPTRVFTPTS